MYFYLDGVLLLYYSLVLHFLFFKGV